MSQEQAAQNRNPLGDRPLPDLLAQFAIPSIIAMLVSSLYNIVDQFFIGQGVGYLGNAATNVAYPLTTICLAIALLIGIGSASRFSLELGAGRPEQAAQAAGNAISMMLLFGVIYMVLVQLFLEPMLMAFGSTEDILPYAVSYTRITALGMPLLILTNGMSNLARADGSPGYSMTCMLVGAVLNTVLDPICIFVFDLGMAGAAWATVAGQFVSFLMAICYTKRFRHIRLRRQDLILRPASCLRAASLGMSSSLNQLALTFVQIVLNNSLTHYGALSPYGKEIPLASCGIVMKVNAMSFFSAIGKPIKGAVLSLTRQVIFLAPLLLILPLVFPQPIDGILFAAPVADTAAFLTSVLLIRREMGHIRRLEQAQPQRSIGSEP